MIKQVKVKPEHIEVISTLHENGLIDKQTMKTVRGNVLIMTSDEAEIMLRKLIKSCGKNMIINMVSDKKKYWS